MKQRRFLTAALAIATVFAVATPAFANRDPEEFKDSHNLYEYVKSRPTVLTDPTGRMAEEPLAAEGVGAELYSQEVAVGRGALGIVEDVVAKANLRSFQTEVRIAIERHHLFPQARSFTQFFKNAGINIDRWKVTLEKSVHRLNPNGWHTNAGGNWNRQWKLFMKETEGVATEDQVWNQLAKMLFETFGY